MKSLLIIGTPKNCGDCPCAGEEFGICQADEKHRDCDWYKIPSWCPLKPMPEKKSVELACQKEEAGNDYGAGLIVGWNDCIRELEE